MASIIAMAYLSWGADIHMNPTPRATSRRSAASRRSSRRSRARASGPSRRCRCCTAHVFAREGDPRPRALSRRRGACARETVTGSWSSCRPAVWDGASRTRESGRGADVVRSRRRDIASESPTPRGHGSSSCGAGSCTPRRATSRRRGSTSSTPWSWPRDRGCRPSAVRPSPRRRSRFASLGSELADEELLAAAERAATDAKELLPLLPGHAPGARGPTLLARVALARATPSPPRRTPAPPPPRCKRLATRT